MQDLASGLRRITLPRTPLNKGKEKGRSYDAPALPAPLALLLALGGEGPRLLLVARRHRVLVEPVARQVPGTGRDHRLVLGVPGQLRRRRAKRVERGLQAVRAER